MKIFVKRQPLERWADWMYLNTIIKQRFMHIEILQEIKEEEMKILHKYKLK